VKVLHVPADMLRPGSRVLLVDDLARTGATLEALADATRKAGASPLAAMVLIAAGDEWTKRLRRHRVEEAHALVQLGLH
jgi:adenine/guanine phosphoribosyltransferase-like PRPP-binding protein